METLNIHNKSVLITEGAPQILGLPDGSAIAVYGAMPDFLERLLSKKYRIVDQNREDVAAELLMSDAESHSERKKARLIVPPLIIRRILADLKDDKVSEFIVATPLTEDKAEQAASAYGTLTSLLLPLVDCRVKSVISGEKYDLELVDQARRIIVQAYQKPVSTRAVIESQLCLIRECGELLPKLCGGVQAEAENALRLLFAHEDRATPPDGMTDLIFSTVIGEIYECYLRQNFGFIAPPDNNFRIEQANDYLGLSERDLTRTVKPIEKKQNLDRIRHCLRVNRGEILAELRYHGKILRASIGRLMRSLPDCGYYYKNSIDRSDLKIALSLCTDISSNDCSLLHVIRSEGLTDNFL